MKLELVGRVERSDTHSGFGFGLIVVFAQAQTTLGAAKRKTDDIPRPLNRC